MGDVEKMIQVKIVQPIDPYRDFEQLLNIILRNLQGRNEIIDVRLIDNYSKAYILYRTREGENNDSTGS